MLTILKLNTIKNRVLYMTTNPIHSDQKCVKYHQFLIANIYTEKTDAQVMLYIITNHTHFICAG